MTESAKNGENTQFRPGNRAKCGHTGNGHLQKLKNALLKSITPKDIREISDAMKREAKKGNPKAATWVGDRVFGKANQTVDLNANVQTTGVIKLKWSDDANRTD